MATEASNGDEAAAANLGRGVRIIKPSPEAARRLSDSELEVGEGSAEADQSAGGRTPADQELGSRDPQASTDERPDGAGYPDEEPPGAADDGQVAAPDDSQGKGELIYVGPPIQRAQADEDEGAENEVEDSESADAEQRDEEQSQEIEQLREEIAGLREQLEQTPGEGVSRIQKLERRLVELEREARLIEQARLERVAGYGDMAKKLEQVQILLADGEWQVLETISWAEWLLQIYTAEAARMGALSEIESNDIALRWLQKLRVALENDDLFEARIDLTFVIAALERARKAAMLETSPVTGAIKEE